MGIVCFWPRHTLSFLNYVEYAERGGGGESSCLTYCDFLKYNKSLTKNYLLPYSNHLIRYWEPELIKHPYKKLEKVTELLS